MQGRILLETLFGAPHTLANEEGPDEKTQVLHDCQKHDDAGHLVHPLETLVGLALVAGTVLEKSEEKQACEDLEEQAEDQVELARQDFDLAASHLSFHALAAKIDTAGGIAEK